MNPGRVGYVVQELDGCQFLCAQDGDVGFTPYLHEADAFDGIQEADDTAHLVVGGNYRITPVWLLQ